MHWGTGGHGEHAGACMGSIWISKGIEITPDRVVGPADAGAAAAAQGLQVGGAGQGAHAGGGRGAGGATGSCTGSQGQN